MSSRGQTSSGKDEFPSPDQRIVIRQSEYRGPILFSDAQTGGLIWRTDSGARFIEVLWSPDSRWAAICERNSRFRAYVRAFAISPQSVTEISLARELRENVLHLVPKAQRLVIIHDEGFGFIPQKWLSGGKLVVQGESGGLVEDARTKENKRCEIVFRFIVQCHRDGSSKLLEKRLLGFTYEQSG
jgi:hypothetical protein